MAKSRKSTDNPFRAGFDARMANVSIVSCPFPNGSEDRAEWIAGFQKACGHLDAPKDEIKADFIEPEGGIAWPKNSK